MNVLMISTDRGLLGRGQLGDVVERHVRYGNYVSRLDIIVFSLSGYNQYALSPNVTAYPTNSKGKVNYYFDAVRLGGVLSKKRHYDLIICQDPFLTALAGLKTRNRQGGKLLVHFHGDFWKNPDWLSEHPVNYLMNIVSTFVVSRADALRVMSEAQKSKMVASGVAPEKIRVISTPVNLKKFETEIEADPLLVVHVGRASAEKDYATLLKAFNAVAAEIPEAKFLQLGGRAAVIDASRRIPSQQLSVVSEGLPRPRTLVTYERVDQKLVVELVQSAAVLVLSSTSESFGKVLIEANAAGKPVVTTATSGGREIVENGVNGFIVPVGDDAAMAEKIIEILKHPERARAMGQQGKLRAAEKYGDNTEKIIAYWRDITRL